MELRTGIADMILRCSKLLWPFAYQFSETCIKLVFEAVNFTVTPICFTLVLDKIRNRTKHLLCSVFMDVCTHRDASCKQK